MTRRELKDLLQNLTREVEADPVPWLQRIRAADGLLTFERTCGEYRIQVEMQLLEANAGYAQIGVGASAGGLSDFFPVSTSIIIETEGTGRD